MANLVVSLVAYFALHSLLAAGPVKIWLSNLVSGRYYRLIYNLLAVALLLPVAWLFVQIPNEPMFQNVWLRPLGWLLLLAGGVWGVVGLKSYDLGEFSGLFQLKTGGQPLHTQLVVGGLNRWVRHPLYFGTLLLAWGYFFASPALKVLALAVVSSIYLVVGSWLEERKLAQQFGEAYRQYQKNVPMLLPLRWPKS